MTRPGLMTAYINPPSSDQFRAVAGYTLADGTPAIDVVCIFAANYASNELPYLRANNNDPPTDKPFNPNIQQVLSDGSVQYLQQKGLKVLMTVGNGQSQVGWSEFTNEVDAQNFAGYLKTEVVDKYGLDGIDIDDEYSKGQPNDTSLIMVTTIMKQLMPDKWITKALFQDYQYFEATWEGHTLAENLNYGWEMSYFIPSVPSRIQPYMQFGGSNNMQAAQLSCGFWSNQSTGVDAGVQWLLDNGCAGAMIFAFESQSNVDLMGKIVNDWYGPGNWNPPGFHIAAPRRQGVEL